MSNKKIVVFLFAVATALAQATAQVSNEPEKKHELGLVIGATVPPSQTVASGIPTSPGSLTFSPSLALGAEFDRGLTASQHLRILAGVDFLASPLDVKLDQRPVNAIPEYAYIFLTPHVRVKFHPTAPISPWFLLGGGYTRFAESAPPGALRAATNTGALEFGGGIDTAPVRRVWKIPVGFRSRFETFMPGNPTTTFPSAGTCSTTSSSQAVC